MIVFTLLVCTFICLRVFIVGPMLDWINTLSGLNSWWQCRDWNKLTKRLFVIEILLVKVKPSWSKYVIISISLKIVDAEIGYWEIYRIVSVQLTTIVYLRYSNQFSSVKIDFRFNRWNEQCFWLVDQFMKKWFSWALWSLLWYFYLLFLYLFIVSYCLTA